MRYTTIRRGKMGEPIVENYLLKMNAKCYRPCVDDFGIDFLVEQDGEYIKIQVKNHQGTNKWGSSVIVNTKPCDADYIAFPIERYGRPTILWIKNQKNRKWAMNFMISKGGNNQRIGRNDYRDYLSSPIKERK